MSWQDFFWSTELPRAEKSLLATVCLTTAHCSYCPTSRLTNLDKSAPESRRDCRHWRHYMTTLNSCGYLFIFFLFFLKVKRKGKKRKKKKSYERAGYRFSKKKKKKKKSNYKELGFCFGDKGKKSIIKLHITFKKNKCNNLFASINFNL